MAQEEEENVAFVLSQLSKEGDRANERANAMERREEEREEAGGRRKYFLRHDATDNNLGSNAAAFLPSSDSALAVLESDIHARSARQEAASGNGIQYRPAIPRGHSRRLFPPWRRQCLKRIVSFYAKSNVQVPSSFSRNIG